MITKEEKVLKDIVTEKMDVVKQQMNDTLQILENAARDVNELVTRSTDPQEREFALRILRDLENTIILDFRQTIDKLNRLSGEVAPTEQLKLASLLKMPWLDMEKTIRKMKNGSKLVRGKNNLLALLERTERKPKYNALERRPCRADRRARRRPCTSARRSRRCRC